jgi:16S rRNA (guanine966-N2)-methyltransferase
MNRSATLLLLRIPPTEWFAVFPASLAAGAVSTSDCRADTIDYMTRRKDPRRPTNTRNATTVTGTLRVIGGTLRGRPIAYSGDLCTRPMKQRVREAMFNLLGPRVVGTHVIDLFAGTGALAWEAMSRGARNATLIERHFPTARLIRQNAASFGLTDLIDVVPGDTFFWGRRLAPQPAAVSGDPPWLVFCSPPYDLYVSQLQPMLELLHKIVDVAPRLSLVVVEADEQFDPGNLPASYAWDVRSYPPAVLAVGEQRPPIQSTPTRSS